MEPVTRALLLKSLDGLAMRAAAVSQNIANVRSPGYRPVRVSFEAALAEAAQSGRPELIASVSPSLSPDPAYLSGDAVRLDLEMADAAATAGRYGALAELLNRQAQITSLAISGGR